MNTAHKAQNALAWTIIGAAIIGLAILVACGPQWKDANAKPVPTKTK